jgi:hypothetical protein
MNSQSEDKSGVRWSAWLGGWLKAKKLFNRRKGKRPGQSYSCLLDPTDPATFIIITEAID